MRAQHAQRKILVVDDEPINRAIVEALLEDTGLLVDSAQDGVEALQKARSGVYDLVLMDMQMPNLNGIEATTRLRELPGYAQTPILAMTANAFAEDRASCLAAGMNDFIVKPIDPELLFAVLLKWLEKFPRQEEQSYRA